MGKQTESGVGSKHASGGGVVLPPPLGPVECPSAGARPTSSAGARPTSGRAATKTGAPRDGPAGWGLLPTAAGEDPGGAAGGGGSTASVARSTIVGASPESSWPRRALMIVRTPRFGLCAPTTRDGSMVARSIVVGAFGAEATEALAATRITLNLTDWVSGAARSEAMMVTAHRAAPTAASPRWLIASEKKWGPLGKLKGKDSRNPIPQAWPLSFTSAIWPQPWPGHQRGQWQARQATATRQAAGCECHSYARYYAMHTN